MRVNTHRAGPGRAARRLATAIAAAMFLVPIALFASPAQAQQGGNEQGVQQQDDDDHGAFDHRTGGFANRYQVTDLVSDQAGVAQVQDPNLVNAWGLSAGPSTPLWVSDNGMDVTTLYRGAVDGSPVQVLPLVVSIPGGAPTGQVFNPTTGFGLTDPTGTHPALFLFASEHGTISAWNQQNQPITAATQVAASPDAIYKGLTLAQTFWGPRLYAADFHGAKIDVFDANFMPVHHPGAFVDQAIPAGFAPFNVQELDGRIYVTYAKQGPTGDDEAGPGNGFVDVFTPEGFLLRRLVSHGALNSPWGLAIAPGGFGRFSRALLVGNFGGDGLIHAYEPHSGAFLGTLRDENHQPIAIEGLWGLRFGNGVFAAPDQLIFTAGPDDESHGLLGVIDPPHKKS